MSADWKPGYSTTKTRYPYDRVETMAIFPNRVEFTQNQEGKIGCNIDVEKYPQLKAWNLETEDSKENKQLMIDFLMDRAFDLQEALKVAENQILELLDEDPFIPEQFGFELVHKPETIHDSPIRVYQSTYDDNYTLHRPVGDVFDDNWDPSIWILQHKNEDNTIFTEELCIPCHRIAYAYFYAKRIKVMNNKPKDFIEEAVIEETIAQGPGSESPVVEEAPVYPISETVDPPKGMCNYNVVYTRELGEAQQLVLENIIAQDDKDAQTQAKFLIETGNYGIDHVNFEELTPILKKSNK